MRGDRIKNKPSHYNGWCAHIFTYLYRTQFLTPAGSYILLHMQGIRMTLVGQPVGLCIRLVDVGISDLPRANPSARYCGWGVKTGIDAVGHTGGTYHIVGRASEHQWSSRQGCGVYGIPEDGDDNRFAGREHEGGSYNWQDFTHPPNPRNWFPANHLVRLWLCMTLNRTWTHWFQAGPRGEPCFDGLQ